MIKVVAALITDGDEFLICRRPAHKSRGNMWEFPGGKVEPGESNKEAIVREIKEELDVQIRAEEEYITVLYDYPELSIELIVIKCTIMYGTPEALEHEEIRWIKAEQADEFEFCGADCVVADKIKKDGI